MVILRLLLVLITTHCLIQPIYAQSEIIGDEKKPEKPPLERLIRVYLKKSFTAGKTKE